MADTLKINMSPSPYDDLCDAIRNGALEFAQIKRDEADIMRRRNDLFFRIEGALRAYSKSGTIQTSEAGKCSKH